MFQFFVIFSFLLDGVLTNFLPFLKGELTLFTPFFTIVFFFLSVPFFSNQKEEKKYYLFAILLGLLYDLFYTNLLVVHAVLFFILAFLFRKIWENIQINFVTIPILLTFVLGIYHFLFIGILLLFHSIQLEVSDFFYLWSHSILLNLLYGELVYFLLIRWDRKYRKVSIN